MKSKWTHTGTVCFPHCGKMKNHYQVKLQSLGHVYGDSHGRLWITQTGERVGGAAGNLLLDTIQPIEEVKS